MNKRLLLSLSCFLYANDGDQVWEFKPMTLVNNGLGHKVLSDVFDVSEVDASVQDVIKKIPFEKERFPRLLTVERNAGTYYVSYFSALFAATDEIKNVMRAAAEEGTSKINSTFALLKRQIEEENEHPVDEVCSSYMFKNGVLYILSDNVFSRYGESFVNGRVWRKVLHSNTGTMRITCHRQGFSDHPVVPCDFFGLCVTFVDIHVLRAPADCVIMASFKSSLLGNVLVVYSKEEDTTWIYAALEKNDAIVGSEVKHGVILASFGSYMIVATLKNNLRNLESDIEILKNAKKTVPDRLKLVDITTDPVLYSKVDTIKCDEN